MNQDIVELRKKFLEIKREGLIRSLRSGPTGVGYTFETLINKKEDQLCQPDYGSVEIKCKLGYSKSPISLFSCSPTRNGNPALNYIFRNYSYHRYGNEEDIKIFSRNIFKKYSTEINEYSFKLNVNYDEKTLQLKAYKSGIYVEDVCEWKFDNLQNVVEKKLKFLALVKAYPYKRNGETYFKYFNINFYKLKSFQTFLKLIENDKIFILIYLKEKIESDGRAIIENHGAVFKIRTENIDLLFKTIFY